MNNLEFKGVDFDPNRPRVPFEDYLKVEEENEELKQIINDLIMLILKNDLSKAMEYITEHKLIKGVDL